MRIVDRDALLALPAGTFYARVPEPIILGEISIKEDPRGETDWWHFQVANWEADSTGDWADKFFEMKDGGASMPICTSTVAEGAHERDAKYLVFERADLQQLRAWVDKAIEVSPA